MAKRIKGFLSILMYLILFPIGMIFYKGKHLWLISERGDDARDNGYWMFLYLRNNQSNINSYYVIDKKSTDYIKIKKYEPYIIQRKSFKHWLIFIAADVRMSTHLFLFAPAPYVGEFIKRHHTKNTINVDLQHGITHNTFPSNYKKINGSDLYICGAKPEYEWIKKNFGWDENSIKYTGFARFDGLHNIVTKKQLLIMPTWRKELRDLNESKFIKSNYYLSWQNLLNSDSLNTILKESGYKCIFYVHYSLQHFSNLFTSNSDYILIATFNNYDVQDLLKESSILITDYSSIFFDFAYMRKPIIYYQFDYDYFYSNHYQKGFFNHKEDGFGEVCYSNNETLRALKNIIASNSILENKYKKRIDDFFVLNDSNNCQRIYEAILERKRKI